MWLSCCSLCHPAMRPIFITDDQRWPGSSNNLNYNIWVLVHSHMWQTLLYNKISSSLIFFHTSKMQRTYAGFDIKVHVFFAGGKGEHRRVELATLAHQPQQALMSPQHHRDLPPPVHLLHKLIQTPRYILPLNRMELQQPHQCHRTAPLINPWIWNTHKHPGSTSYLHCQSKRMHISQANHWKWKWHHATAITSIRRQTPTH